MDDRHSVTVYWDKQFERYQNPKRALTLPPSMLFAVDEPHPDRPERIRNIRHIVTEVMEPQVRFEDVDPAPREALERVHESGYIDMVEDGGADAGPLSPHTPLTSDTYRTAKLAAGAAMATAETAIHDDTTPYALARPSGHHAQPDRADGFCYFNNVAVAAEHALTTTRVDRVAIVDWDVHHGNGTQECFYDREDVLFVSIHNDHRSWDPETHPQEGTVTETGEGPGQGFTVNVPVPFGTGDRGYAYAIDSLINPIVAAFDPDLILVSAGQDAGPRDPLGRNVLTRQGFKDLGRRVRDLADAHAGGRLGVVQEGGYQLTHLALATLGVLEGVAGLDADYKDGPFTPETDPFAWPAHSENYDLAVEWIEDARRSVSDQWAL